MLVVEARLARFGEARGGSDLPAGSKLGVYEFTGRRDETDDQLEVWQSLLSATVGLTDQGPFHPAWPLRRAYPGAQRSDDAARYLACRGITKERSVHESAAQRYGDCMGAIFRAELVQDALHASLDRIFGNE